MKATGDSNAIKSPPFSHVSVASCMLVSDGWPWLAPGTQCCSTYLLPNSQHRILGINPSPERPCEDYTSGSSSLSVLAGVLGHPCQLPEASEGKVRESEGWHQQSANRMRGMRQISSWTFKCIAAFEIPFSKWMMAIFFPDLLTSICLLVS
jgi:hypothetical protein